MNKQIRVLCVFASLDMGGAETLWINVYRNLDRNRVQLDFVKHTDRIGVYEEEIKSLGGIIYTSPRYNVINIVKYKRWWTDFFKSHPEYRIVHGHYFTIANVFLSVAKRFRRITVLHSHANKNSVGATWIKNLHTRRANKFADYCLACSEDAGKWLFPHREFLVINNGIDLDRFRFDIQNRENIRKQFELENCLVVGTVGRFEAPKNPYGIINIVEKTLKKDTSIKFLWVGDGVEMANVVTTVRKKGIDDSIVLTGVRNDIPDMLSAMDVFILPSNYEGLGIVLIEAQMNGLQCIASSNVPKEVNVTGNVEFLPLDDYNLWANKIIEKSGFERKDCKAALVKFGYEIKDVAKKMEHFYLRLYEM